jgi:lipid-binding SYLF domain-containing protein
MLLDDDAELASIWSYVKSKNLHYEGLKLDGTVLAERTDENA